jgi:hypothetical protein
MFAPMIKSALLIGAVALAAGCSAGTPPPSPHAVVDAAKRSRDMPRYDHIFVIVIENKGFDQIAQHPDWAPTLDKLASEYGQATQFYGEVHPSEGNYVAMLGGDTFGIHDDDAYFCKPRMQNPFCKRSDEPGYADHSLSARSLMDQLQARGLSWKVYMQDIPGAGSLIPAWPTRDYPVQGLPHELYAAKHNGFVNFDNVHQAPLPWRMQHIVGFNQLDKDLAAGDMPNYAHIIPNQCNEMHGRGSADGPDVPPDCDYDNVPGLIKRGDAEIGRLVGKIMQSGVWHAAGNVAIVITADENNAASRQHGRQGCCGHDPASAANFGGGRIMTLVITNHGPRHVIDATPYNHYSLLRTTEDAFGIHEYLRHAADTAHGVVSMTPLFAVPR